MIKPIISLEAALAHNRVIGAGGKVPWNLPADRRHWRQLVAGHTIIVGDVTFRQQGVLENSLNIVISRDQALAQPKVLVAGSVDEALDLASQRESTESFVVGGASIFQQTIDRADKLYLTLINLDVPNGDRFFPEFKVDFHQIKSAPGSDNGLDYEFTIWQRN